MSWSSYGKFLSSLQTHRWDSTLNLFFEFPVHCFGYNWTASNRLSGKQLASYIDEVSETYTKQSRRCDKVIIVTHSMGGLVARAACKLSGAESKVLAVIHGVQPASGSPAAYWRMKGGFERPHHVPDIEPMQWFRNVEKSVKFMAEKGGNNLAGHVTAWILGTDGEEVTALLGNMPGGLQLLPNRYYTDNLGSRSWLQLVDNKGKIKSLPVKDPYEEIYRKQGVYYRLVKPEWLNPGKHQETVAAFEDEDWFSYLDYLSEAEGFHDDLYDEAHANAYHHPETYQFYSTGLASADRVVFARSEDKFWQSAKRILGSLTEGIPRDFKGIGKALVFTVAGLGVPFARKLIDVAYNAAGGAIIKDTDWYANRGGYRDRVNDVDIPSIEGQVNLVTMQLPNGSGDGTVPISSGHALELPEDTKRTFSIGEKCGFEERVVGDQGAEPDFDEACFDRAHEPIFSTASAQHITFTTIENICRKEIKRRMGIS